MKSNLQDLNSLNLFISKPIAFNCWKHHFGYLKDYIILNRVTNPELVIESLNYIGDSMIDLYVGSLDCDSIANQIRREVLSIGISNYDRFKGWIQSEDKEYHKLIVSDGSEWVLRLGNQLDRYIHIHPCRYSKQTIRVKGSTLKTCIVYLLEFGFVDQKVDCLKFNQVRLKYTKLPPLNLKSSPLAVSRILSCFFN